MIIILILIYISIPIIIFTIYRNSKNNDNKIIKQKEEDTIKLAESKAKEYLNNTYNMDYKIKLESNGFKSNEFSIDGSYFECGHDEDILEYVFAVYTNDLDEPFYVTVWMDKEKREIEVKEVNGSSSNKDNTSYDTYKYYEEQKKLIKDDLYNIISSNYKTYNIDDKSDADAIIVNTHEYLYNEYNKDTIGKIIDLLNDKNIKIKMIYNDAERYYNSYSKIENETNFINLYYEVYSYLSTNYNYPYKLYINNIEHIVIKIDENIYINYNDNYETLYSNLLDISKKNSEYIYIDFNDRHITITPHNTKTLKETLYD